MKIAVITGASSGMGRDFTIAIDKEYELDEIWVIARRRERLESLADQCRAKIRPLAMDLLDRKCFSVYSDLLAELKPKVQFLVNAAGFGLFGDFTEMDMLKQLDIIDLNAKALTAFCHMTLSYMPDGSHIINLASNSSWQPVPYMNVYAASKAYVMSFSRALGMELRKRRIHVMAVAPGWIKTEFFDTAIHDDTISYFDRYYTSQQVIDRAMKDLRKKRPVSILGLPVRMQVHLVKHLPVSLVMKTWCRQQGK